jgi:phosphoenolpyruvate carboxylase
MGLTEVSDMHAMHAGDKTQATQMLASKLRLRAPYVVPLNILQAQCMADIRDMPSPENENNNGNSGLLKSGSRRSYPGKLDWNAYADPETWNLLNREPENLPDKDLLLQAYKDTLMITIKGIAAGMQNTG